MKHMAADVGGGAFEGEPAEKLVGQEAEILRSVGIDVAEWRT